ncbi:MAG: lysophospholipid acyltransferase family protein [Ignavibacteriae bacterium]|nr:lysophospholipid acyltransferase family protein [Ignavibacteriota bacterium]
MIKAKHNTAAEFLYKPYVKKLLRSGFSRFILTNNMPDISGEKGIIVTPNHFSWWDGFFIEYLMRKFTDRKLYIMMLEDQLKKYPFFKYLGAFSIKPGSVRSVAESLIYAKDIAQSESAYLVFYPQGEIQNYEVEHVKLKKGLGAVSLNKDTGVLIVAFKIVYGNEKKPDVYCRFHDRVLYMKTEDDVKVYEKLFLKNIVMLNTDVITGKGTDLLA